MPGIFFSKTLSVASAALWNTFLEIVFRASIPVSNNCILHFLANDKNPYSLTYFPVLGSIEYQRLFSLLIRNVKLTLPSTSSGLPF